MMRTIRPLLPIVLLAIVLGGCSSSASLSTVGGPVGENTDSAAKPAPLAQDGALEPGAPVPGTGATGGNAIGARDDAKIIRTGSMALEVRDVPTALRTARDAIVALGGYVGASTTKNEGDQPVAEITYRIPADRWEAALDALRSLNGQTTKVVAEHTEAAEVTAQVIDLEARIKNLRSSELALQAIAEKATKVSDVLEVEARLTETRGQIEQLTAQLKDLNDRADFATLAVSFNVPVVAVEVAARNWDPKTAVDEAAASMLAILQNLVTAGIWFAIVWLPILVVLGLFTAIAVWIARRLGFRARTRDETPPSAPPSETPPGAPSAPPAEPLASEG